MISMEIALNRFAPSELQVFLSTCIRRVSQLNFINKLKSIFINQRLQTIDIAREQAEKYKML